MTYAARTTPVTISLDGVDNDGAPGNDSIQGTDGIPGNDTVIGGFGFDVCTADPGDFKDCEA